MFDVANKAQNAYGYSNGDQYQITQNDGRRFWFCDNNKNFIIPYAPNMWQNNVATEYRIVGGESCQWDFIIPDAQNQPGQHTCTLQNSLASNHNIAIESFRVYEITNITTTVL